MTFLPIVERELRVAAGRKSTYRIRLWSALFGSLVCGLFLLISLAGSSGSLGAVLLSILTVYAAIFCALTGVMMTADCLSGEKREGTLGLLFLTDLKGYDVVLGKFCACGLNVVYGLLATFPVMAIPLLLGGVTAAEFWRVLLALLNVLFVSLTTGMLVSSWSRDDRKAVGAALLWVIFLDVFVPLASVIEAGIGLSDFTTYISWLSPVQTLILAKATAGSGHYWPSLLGSQLVGWLSLALASGILPRAWQDRPAHPKDTPARPLRTSRRARLVEAERRELLDINPVLGLIGSNRGLRYNIITVVFLGCTASTLALWFEVGRMNTGMVPYAAMPFGLLIKVWFAVQASRFFVDARRTGALELLLCTPLTDREVFRGQWLALKRLFYWPVCVLLGYQLLLGVVQLGYVNPRGGIPFQLEIVLGFGRTLFYLVTFVADLFALGWLGMWLGISAKRPGQAATLTVLFVLILPALIPCLPAAIIDLIILAHARSRLQRDFRKRVLQQFSPIAFPSARPPGPADSKLPPLLKSS